jgi:CHAT domain-containing protein
MPSLSGLYGRYGKVTRYDFFSLPAGGLLIMADECISSLNGLYHGSELPAFTGPFFQAGASAVLFTLWPPPPAVRDEAFSLFLRELESSGSPGAALKAMQAAMRKKYPLPINWAPYALYGK